jgi:hypothetical protein
MRFATGLTLRVGRRRRHRIRVLDHTRPACGPIPRDRRPWCNWLRFRIMQQRRWGAAHSAVDLLTITLNHCPVLYARRRVSVHGFPPVTARSASAPRRVGEFPRRLRRLVLGRHAPSCRRSCRPRNRRRSALLAACDPRSETLRVRKGRPGADSTARAQSALRLRHGALRYARANMIVVGGTCSHNRKT